VDVRSFFFNGDVKMENGMIELLEKISRSTSFLAVGGTVALMFLLVFAQSIFGSKTTHKQIEKLLSETERMNGQLKQIAQCLKEGQGTNAEEGAEGSADRKDNRRAREAQGGR